MFRMQGAFAPIAAVAVAVLGIGCDRLLGLDGSDAPPEQRVDHEQPTDSGAVSGMDDASDVRNAPDDPCDSYCEQVTTTCTGNNRVYATKAECLGFCKILLAPAPKDLSCRNDALQMRSDDSLDSCMKAGPGGYSPMLSECESGPCSSYCTLMAGLCPDYDLQFGPVIGASASKSHEDCVAECKNTFKPTMGYIWDPVSWATIEEATAHPGVACRIYHLGLALEARDAGKPDLLQVHCQHAAGQKLCGPPVGADAGGRDH
jgi:hypothetical protein